MEENKISLESIEEKLRHIKISEDAASMAYPPNSSDYYYISKKYYEVLRDLQELKGMQKDDSLSKIIDNKIEEVRESIRLANTAAQDIDRHESEYGSYGM